MSIALKSQQLKMEVIPFLPQKVKAVFKDISPV